MVTFCGHEFAVKMIFLKKEQSNLDDCGSENRHSPITMLLQSKFFQVRFIVTPKDYKKARCVFQHSIQEKGQYTKAAAILPTSKYTVVLIYSQLSSLAAQQLSNYFLFLIQTPLVPMRSCSLCLFLKWDQLIQHPSQSKKVSAGSFLSKLKEELVHLISSKGKL